MGDARPGLPNFNDRLVASNPIGLSFEWNVFAIAF